ncbi:MAG: GTP cyclohydrolase II [Myxococcales bacterium]|nr:GTP cyclohydrolase II [Myxococcales bacterium]MCB9539320.1 GTP cyclohydrolase II [Myxococcales bacterium]
MPQSKQRAPAEPPFYARTRLPTAHGTFDVRVLVDGEGREHLAISVGQLEGARGLPVRVHSECLTSEVLGSLKCDCKPQLDAALAAIQAAGRGAVLYLRQEGRGIGLGNKIRAYAMQEAGLDTVDANRVLGFGDDLRDYAVAATMLEALGVESVRLLTNNPLKIEGLRDAGVDVEGRDPLVTGVNPVNRGYLETKRARMGHLYAPVRPEAGQPA